MIREFATRDALMQAAASRIAEALQSGIDKRGRASAALSGGSTPEPAYRALAALPVNWSHVTFGLVDERFVTPSSYASNQGMVERALAPAFSAGAKFAPMYMHYASLDEAAKRADAAYAKLRFDIAVMGMGEDGHTASWFPDTEGLKEALDLSTPHSVIAVHAPDAAATPERLTLTRRAVSKARSVLLLITGLEKRARFEQAMAKHDAPVSKLFHRPIHKSEVWWAP